MLTYRAFFDLLDFPHPDLFDEDEWVWEALNRLPAYLHGWGNRPGYTTQESRILGSVSSSARLHGDSIFIGRGSVIEDGVTIHGPTIIGDHCEVRQGAYIRGNTIIGDLSQTGCNCVTNPGTLIGRNSLIYPNAIKKGYIPDNSVVKLRQQTDIVARR